MLFTDMSRNERRQDSSEQQNQDKPVTAKPESEEMMLESKQVISELKPPPKARESVVNGAHVRDSFSSINQEAAVIERVIRESGPDKGISSGEMMAEMTLAKNYVVDTGQRDIAVKPTQKDSPNWQEGLEGYLKNSQAIALGVPLDQMIPNAESVGIASSLSNASPQAQKIAQANGIEIPLELQIPMIQAIAQSQDRLAGGQPRMAAAPAPGATLQDTLDRIRHFALFGAPAGTMNPQGFYKAELAQTLAV